MPPTPALPWHNHHRLEPELNLGGSRGPPCRERIQQALPGLGTASNTPKSPAWHPKPPSPWLLRAPGARGNFFFSKLRRKSLWDHSKHDCNPKRQQGLGLRPLQGTLHGMGMLAGKQGCWEGAGDAKSHRAEMSRAKGAVPWARGREESHEDTALQKSAPLRVWSLSSLCTNTHIYPILSALRVTLKESLKES